MKRKGLLILIICLALPLILMGGAKKGEAAETEYKYTIGLSLPALDSLWWVRAADFTEYVGKVLGAKIITVGCDYKEEKQLKDVEDLIAKGVDGLIVLPETSAIGLSILRTAEQSHVYIQGADRSLGVFPDEWKGKYYVGHIALDDVEAGYKNAKALLEAGCRNLVSINHVRGTSVSELRQEGLLKALKEYPDAKLLATQWNVTTREEAVSAAESLLLAYPDVDGIYTVGDIMSLGAMTVVERAGKLGKIKIAGMDLIEETMQGLKEGKLLYQTDGHWVSAGFGLIMLIDKLNGHDPLQRLIWIKGIGGTKDNVDKFRAKFIDQEIYTPDEIKQMSLTFNPNAKLAEWIENMDQKMK